MSFPSSISSFTLLLSFPLPSSYWSLPPFSLSCLSLLLPQFFIISLSFPCNSSFSPPLLYPPPPTFLYFTYLLSFFFLPLHSSVVLFDLLVNILGHNLAEPAYEAEVAQLEYKLVAGEHGLVIKVKGFNHKLPVSECIWRHRMHKTTHTDE